MQRPAHLRGGESSSECVVREGLLAEVTFSVKLDKGKQLVKHADLNLGREKVLCPLAGESHSQKNRWIPREAGKMDVCSVLCALTWVEFSCVRFSLATEKNVLSSYT